MSKIIAFVLALLALPVHAASIWGSTNRAPAAGTMRFPVDTSSSSSPGYLNITAVNAYVWGNPTGTLPVANGGTNLTAATDDNVMVGNGTTWQSKALTSCSGASNAVTYNTTTNAWGCNSLSGTGTVTHTTGALTASRLIVGNGTDDIKPLASLGTITTVLHGNAAGLPTFGPVELVDDVSGVLPVANGGLGVELTDPHADVVIGWDNSINEHVYYPPGVGLQIDGGVISASNNLALFDSADSTTADEGEILLVGSGGALEWSAPPTGSNAKLEAAIAALSPNLWYKLDEASGNFADSSGGGYALTPAGSPNYRHAVAVPQDATRFVMLDASDYGTRSGVSGLTVPLNGAFSVCFLTKSITTPSNPGTYLSISGSGSSETEVDNTQISVYGTSSSITMAWEYGAGSNETVALDFTYRSREPYFICAVKSSGMTYLYVNGVLLDTTAYSNEPTGGSGTMLTQIGQVPGGFVPIVGQQSIAHVFYEGSALTLSQVETLAKAAGLLGL